MKMNNFEELQALLSKPKKITIIPHRNPDGDAIGSVLAMFHYLTKLGHQCDVVSPNDFPKFLKWMEGAKSIFITEYNPGKARRMIENAELIFILDFNCLARIEELGEWVQASKALKIMIDHHQEPETFDFMYSDTSVPATCQMVYDFIEAMDDLDCIDTSIAECIYTGIMTDTGNFRFKNTGARTHRLVAELLEKGIEVDKIYNNVYDTQSEGRLKLLSLCLGSLETLPEFRTAYMYLTRTQQLEYSSQKGDTEGFVNYGLGIAGFVFSVIFIEDQQNDFIKISFRSKGDFDVNSFARKHFNGGGHINAAGGRSDLTMEETIRKFETIIQEYKEELQHTII
ncbi:MAG: bifunctional oligoribonuclease/PAP phosphatase NrnA [Weeksellaceae bacterium]|jgi:phosphoesterase RecJ-like protein|nr:bifunctional oligoribonuclease/PAP phosphatase NrnA [Weeksellaceae bacterium]MDX9704476.1 bifunctional oligoribonuclease/PAP phosphatase NrnA [Weeksellaceae bacterium]